MIPPVYATLLTVRSRGIFRGRPCAISFSPFHNLNQDGSDEERPVGRRG
jgi:hypothetical protein